jgi:hypothetical protein
VTHSFLVGGLAQLGEHLLCKQGVVGSIPSSSTNQKQSTTKRLRKEGALLLVSIEKPTRLFFNNS